MKGDVCSTPNSIPTEPRWLYCVSLVVTRCLGKEREEGSCPYCVVGNKSDCSSQLGETPGLEPCLAWAYVTGVKAAYSRSISTFWWCHIRMLPVPMPFEDLLPSPPGAATATNYGSRYGLQACPCQRTKMSLTHSRDTDAAGGCLAAVVEPTLSAERAGNPRHRNSWLRNVNLF